VSPPPSRVAKRPAVLLSPVPSIQPQFATSPSPPPSTQTRRHAAPTHPIIKRGAPVATRHGKPSLTKKTAVDRFNESRQEESRRLNLKRKMEHDEKMASIRLKRHKYDLRYGSTPEMHTSSSTPALVAATTKEDKQIEILRLQIRLAELTRDNSHASSHTSSHASTSRTLTSQMPPDCDTWPFDEASTPSSGMSNLSYSFVGNNFTTSETSWPKPDTFNFAA
jgi:hypothetical protein